MNPSERKRGIYQTTYGNSAYVSGPSAQYAFDLDMRERIPMDLVSDKMQRKATAEDVLQATRNR